MLKKIFKYIEPMWLDNKGQVSLRSIGAIALIIDFIRNVHNSAAMVTKVLKLLFVEKPVDPNLISAMSGNLAQIAMILATEAALIAAMLALKTYQPVNPSGYQPTPPPQQQPPEEKDKDQHIQL